MPACASSNPSQTNKEQNLSATSKQFEKLIRDPKLFRPKTARLPLPPAIRRNNPSQFVYVAMPGYDIWDPGSSSATDLLSPGKPATIVLGYDATKDEVRHAYNMARKLDAGKFNVALVMPPYARAGLPPVARKAPHRLGSVWGVQHLYDALEAALPPGMLPPTEDRSSPIRWDFSPAWLKELTRQMMDARGNVLPVPWLRAVELAGGGMAVEEAAGQAMMEWAPRVLTPFLQFATAPGGGDPLTAPDREQMVRAWERQRVSKTPTDWYLTWRECLTFAENFALVKRVGAGRVKWGPCYVNLFRFFLRDATLSTNLAACITAAQDEPDSSQWRTFAFPQKPKPTATDLPNSELPLPPTPR